MATDTNIKIDGISYQRNGISGEGFYQVFFRFSEKGIAERNLIAVLTGDKTYCFVIDPLDIEDHWRGDNFESDLRKSIVNYYAKKYDCSYEEKREHMNMESNDHPW